MTGKTHMMGGLAAASLTAHFIHQEPIVMMAAGVFGALLPDICHTGSKIGKRLPLLSRAISTIFGHRTITHSILFLFIIQLITQHYVPYEAFSKGLLVGMISHLVLDAATKQGIQLLYPLKIRVRFPLTTRTGSGVESFVLVILTVMSIYYVGLDLMIF